MLQGVQKCLVTDACTADDPDRLLLSQSVTGGGVGGGGGPRGPG